MPKMEKKKPKNILSKKKSNKQYEQNLISDSKSAHHFACFEMGHIFFQLFVWKSVNKLLIKRQKLIFCDGLELREFF